MFYLEYTPHVREHPYSSPEHGTVRRGAGSSNYANEGKMQQNPAFWLVEKLKWLRNIDYTGPRHNLFKNNNNNWS